LLLASALLYPSANVEQGRKEAQDEDQEPDQGRQHGSEAPEPQELRLEIVTAKPHQTEEQEIAMKTKSQIKAGSSTVRLPSRKSFIP